MDTQKLITVTVWATLAVIAYEVLKSVFGTASTVAGSTLAQDLNSPSVLFAQGNGFANLVNSLEDSNLGTTTADTDFLTGTGLNAVRDTSNPTQDGSSSWAF